MCVCVFISQETWCVSVHVCVIARAYSHTHCVTANRRGNFALLSWTKMQDWTWNPKTSFIVSKAKWPIVPTSVTLNRPFTLQLKRYSRKWGCCLFAIWWVMAVPQIDDENLLLYLIYSLQRAVTKILETGFLLTHSPLLTSFHFALNFNVMLLHLPQPPLLYSARQ